MGCANDEATKNVTTQPAIADANLTGANLIVNRIEWLFDGVAFNFAAPLGLSAVAGVTARAFPDAPWH